MIRLGQLTPVDQRKHKFIRPAPERRGIWAFPWPYFDMFFAYHKFAEVLPKRLTEPDTKLYKGEDGYTDWEKLREDFPLERVDEAKQWVKTVGPKVMKVRSFWWSGDVWTRFHNDNSYDYVKGWNLMPLSLYIEKLRYHEAASAGWGEDHFEVFLPYRRGKVTGRVGRENG